MKTCSTCKTEKPKDEFYKKSTSRDGMQSACKYCSYQSAKKSIKKNPEKRNARVSAWQKANPDKCAEINKRYRSANKEKISDSARKYHTENSELISAKKLADRISNPEKYALRALLYRNNNKEKRAESTAAWRNNNPETRAEQRRRRRAAELGAEGSHKSSDIKGIFESQRGLCASCETKLFKSGANKYHVDHIMPLALGGSNWPANLQCLCPRCNMSKGAKDPLVWASENGRLL